MDELKNALLSVVGKKRKNSKTLKYAESKLSAEEKKALGQMVRSERKKKYTTQFNLAHMLGITPSALCQIEKGHTVPSHETIKALQEFFGYEIPEMPGSSESNLRQTTRTALKLLRFLAEKREEGFVVQLRRGEEVIQLELLL